VISGAWAIAARDNPPVRDMAGWLLFGLLMALLLVNLYAAGTNAARKRAS
jgi:hypothetical protein